MAVATTVLPPAAGPQAQVGVFRDEQGHQQSQQHRTGSKEKGGAWDDGILFKVVLWAGVCPQVRSCHRQLFQFHVEYIENEPVQSWSETVAQPSNSCYHSLDDTLLIGVSSSGHERTDGGKGDAGHGGHGPRGPHHPRF